jgi:hypothetical protein
MREHPLSALFHKGRDELYRFEDPEDRDRAFMEFYDSWFSRLDLAAPIQRALNEEPALIPLVRCCIVARSPTRQEEGAELFVNSEEKAARDQRVVRILLKPESILAATALLTFLRHELLHLIDMLDPHFGYEPHLPATAGGPTHEGLVKNRYRVLWDATIDGRLVRRGWLPPATRAKHLLSFAHAFPMLGAEADQALERFFVGDPHTHAELMAFACTPTGAELNASISVGRKCCLCGFSTYAFEPDPNLLPAEVIQQVTADFPYWRPHMGLCSQCADLYRAHHLSAAAALCLPGAAAPQSGNTLERDRS